jgi:hypothetical protein
MPVTFNTDSPPPPRQPFFQRLVEIALIVLVFFIVGGDPPPGINESHYLCRLKQFWNPYFCRGDLFLESADTQIVLIWSFGWVTRWLSLAATAWVGRVVAWALLAWAWQRLSWRLVPRRMAAVLSAALFVTLNGVAHLAGEWVVGGVEAKCFAYVFVLLALRALIDRRWNGLWVHIGAAAAFHPLVGGWSGLVCGGIWLWDDRRQVGLTTMLPGLVAGGLLAMVGVVPALLLTANVSPDVVAEAARIYVFERLPHHLALLKLPQAEITVRLLRHAGLIVALFGLMRTAKALAEPVAHSPAPIARIGQFAMGAVLLAVVGFGIEIVLWNEPLTAAKLLRYYWFRLTDFAVPMAVAMYAVAVIAGAIELRRKWAVWALVAALMLVGWQMSTVVRGRMLNRVPPADLKMRDYAAWVEACEWIAANTPADALFLTPRSSQSFKWRTGRAEVATRKDIPQDAASMVEWFGRVKNIFSHDVYGIRKWVESPSELGDERVKELAKEYGFNYVLADRSQLLRLPVAYMNEEYVVYRIEPSKK